MAKADGLIGVCLWGVRNRDKFRVTQRPLVLKYLDDGVAIY